MKIKYYLLMILVLGTVLVACNKDDGPEGETAVPVKDRAEQQVIDNDSLIGYLETHYYNSSAFVSNPDPSLSDLIITELPEDGILPDPTNNTILIDAIEERSTVFEETDYKFYILKLNQGGGDTPSFADLIRVTYEGFLLDDTVFDSAVTPVDFDMVPNLGGSIISGWRKVFPEFSEAESFVDNGDGTVDFMNHGVGVMFLPSGLAYFSQTQATIPAYSPLIFKFELLQTSQNDHDNDGIPSYLEDLNGDTELTIDDDDTDGDLLPDYFDADDDGDGILTINELVPTVYTIDTNQGEQEPVLEVGEFEISRSDDAGIITINTVKIVDSNNDGINDYLDENITINYNDEG